MRRLIASCVLCTAALGCDARAGDDYRGEALLQLRGSLLLEQGELAPESVPALAFPDYEGGYHILDVDAHGEFPASFSIDVMSPPPAAALREVPDLPSFAVARITALPKDHEDRVTFPTSADGGGETWCKDPDNSDCYRRIDTCVTGTDQCYHELARCTPRPIPDTIGPWCDDDTLGEILEQSGDESLWYHWAKFAGLSLNYAVLYIAGDAPAGSAREYLASVLQLAHTAAPARVFGPDEPVTAGYYLVKMSRTDDEQRAEAEACFDRNDRASMMEYNQAHGTSFERIRDLEASLFETTDNPYADPEVRAVMNKIMFATYDQNCQVIGVEYKRVDPQNSPITVTLGVRDTGISL